MKFLLDESLPQKLRNDFGNVHEIWTVKDIYIIMEQEIEEATVVYTDELKAELDSRASNYKSGKTKTVTPKESKKRIQKILSTTRNNV